ALFQRNKRKTATLQAVGGSLLVVDLQADSCDRRRIRTRVLHGTSLQQAGVARRIGARDGDGFDSRRAVLVPLGLRPPDDVARMVLAQKGTEARRLGGRQLNQREARLAQILDRTR